MKKLYLVPVLHMNADMGSLAPSLDETSETELGKEIWQQHKDAISSFWDRVARFLDALDVKSSKIYQDGMVAEGADGMRIIREGISRGSKNYLIIGNLLERGAVLIKTEDLSLVKQEYDYIAKIAHAASKREKEAWAIRYRLAKGNLLKRRDDYIAKRIDETLHDEETGILFIGASHDVSSRLPSDIKVIQVRDLPQPV